MLATESAVVETCTLQPKNLQSDSQRVCILFQSSGKANTQWGHHIIQFAFLTQPRVAAKMCFYQMIWVSNVLGSVRVGPNICLSSHYDIIL